MSHGFKMWDASGNVVFDSTTITIRLIATLVAPGGATGSFSNSSYAGSILVTTTDNATGWVQLPHAVLLIGSTINYYAMDPSTATTILVFKKT